MIKRMTIAVTEAMVNEVSRAFGVWNRARIRTTLERVFELAPDGGAIDVPVTARLHIQIDEQHLHAQVVEALERAGHHLPSAAPAGRAVATFEFPFPGAADPDDPRIGLPTLGGVSEIAGFCDVARSTVSGWIKAAADNGMPGPLAVLQAGPVYDLEAVGAWHSERKAGPAPEGA